MIYKCTFLRSFGLTQKNQKLKATLRRLQIRFPPLKSRITRASRSDSRDFFTLRSQFALRLLRQAGPSPLYLLLFLIYFSFSNSQSSIINSQKAGVFLSFHAGFSTKDAGFLSFHTYLLKTNKRESISILTGFTFDSRLSGLAFFYYIPTIPQVIFLYTLHTPIHSINYQALPVKGVKKGDYSSTGSPKRVAEDALWILTRMN